MTDDGVQTGADRESAKESRSNLLPEILGRNTGFLIGRVGQLAREDLTRALEAINLKPRHYGVLAVLGTEGPHPQRVLSEKLRVDRSTMVAVVDDLEEMGLVQRIRDREDRRRYGVVLTDAGMLKFSEAHSVVEDVRERVLAPLDDAQRRQLQELLTMLLRNLGQAGRA